MGFWNKGTIINKVTQVDLEEKKKKKATANFLITNHLCYKP